MSWASTCHVYNLIYYTTLSDTGFMAIWPLGDLICPPWRESVFIFNRADKPEINEDLGFFGYPPLVLPGNQIVLTRCENSYAWSQVRAWHWLGTTLKKEISKEYDYYPSEVVSIPDTRKTLLFIEYPMKLHWRLGESQSYYKYFLLHWSKPSRHIR